VNRPLVAVKRNNTVSRIAIVTKLIKCQLLFHAAVRRTEDGIRSDRESSFGALTECNDQENGVGLMMRMRTYEIMYPPGEHISAVEGRFFESLTAADSGGYATQSKPNSAPSTACPDRENCFRAPLKGSRKRFHCFEPPRREDPTIERRTRSIEAAWLRPGWSGRMFHPVNTIPRS
jgi:hypothetical protein